MLTVQQLIDWKRPEGQSIRITLPSNKPHCHSHTSSSHSSVIHLIHFWQCYSSVRFSKFEMHHSIAICIPNFFCTFALCFGSITYNLPNDDSEKKDLLRSSVSLLFSDVLLCTTNKTAWHCTFVKVD